MQNTKAFYTPSQIAIAALIGSPLAGAWLMSRNYKLLKEENKKCSLFFFLAVFCLAVSISVLLIVLFQLPTPEKLSSLLNPASGIFLTFWLSFSLLFRYFLKSTQRNSWVAIAIAFTLSGQIFMGLSYYMPFIQWVGSGILMAFIVSALTSTILFCFSAKTLQRKFLIEKAAENLKKKSFLPVIGICFVSLLIIFALWIPLNRAFGPNIAGMLNIGPINGYGEGGF